MAKAKQIKVSPPPSQSKALLGEDFTSTWKNWFALLYDVLEAQGLVSKPPSGEDGGMPSYWHKVFDPAWAHMASTLQGPTHPTIGVGSVIAPWETNVLNDWQLVSNISAGTITLDNNDYEETGVYQMSVTGYVGGSQGADYVITAYLNGVATGLDIPVSFAANASNGAVAWSGVVSISPDDLDENKQAVLDLRLEYASSGSITVEALNWSMHRISPLNS